MGDDSISDNRMNDYKMYINGNWLEGEAREVRPVVNPAHG
jgi:hypothetical protein